MQLILENYPASVRPSEEQLILKLNNKDLDFFIAKHEPKLNLRHNQLTMIVIRFPEKMWCELFLQTIFVWLGIE